MTNNQSLKYELGIIKEYGENEAVVDVNGKEYHILLSEEEDQLIENMLLNDDIDYVAFDTEIEKIVFDDVFCMNEIDNDVLKDIEEGITNNGEAE